MGTLTPERERLLGALGRALPESAAAFLASLPEPELAYLAGRPDRLRRYAAGSHGLFLLEWEMSAVARGEAALAEIGPFLSTGWSASAALDVGCSDGGFMVAVARRGAAAFGVDRSFSSVQAARLRAAAWGVAGVPVCGTATGLPFAGGAFALVTCGDVIEHVGEKRAAIGEMARVLAPGGLLWLTAPTRFLLANLRADPHYGCFGVAALPRPAAAWYLAHVRHRLRCAADYDVETLPTFAALTRAVEAAGLEIVRGDYPDLREPPVGRAGWRRRALRFGARAGLGRLISVAAPWLTELFVPLRLLCRKPGRA